MINKFIDFIVSQLKKYWKFEIVRFLFVGGINTVFGGFALPFIIGSLYPNATHWNMLGLDINMPITIGYLIWFTPAYLLQVYVSFKSRPEVKRYVMYPFTQIPNYALQQSFFFIFASWLGWPDLIGYGLSALLPIPIMFVLVRLIVKNAKK